MGEIPLTADYQIMLSDTYSEEELEALTEQVKSLPYVERSSLNYAFELEEDSYQYYPNDPKWDDWESTGGNNWNMKAIDAPGAWAYRNQMGPANVGVIDRCFDADHVDLNFSEEHTIMMMVLTRICRIRHMLQELLEQNSIIK